MNTISGQGNLDVMRILSESAATSDIRKKTEQAKAAIIGNGGHATNREIAAILAEFSQAKTDGARNSISKLTGDSTIKDTLNANMDLQEMGSSTQMASSGINTIGQANQTASRKS